MKLSAVTATAVTALALAGCAADSGPAAPPASASGAGRTATSPGTSPTAAQSEQSAASPSGQSNSPSGQAAACGQQSSPHPELAGQLPAGIATLAGWQPTAVVNQGSTRVLSGVLRGEAAGLVAVRDAAARQLTVAGYAQTGSDEEPGHEAEAEFSGPHDVNLTVRPLCRGYLVLSYTVGP